MLSGYDMPKVRSAHPASTPATTKLADTGKKQKNNYKQFQKRLLAS
jgi:hypothetical protein